MTIVAVVPAYNAERTIAATVDALRAFATEVVVVDDGSSDATRAEATRAGARCIVLGSNKGKGAALTAGVQEAGGDVIVFADADLGASAANLKVLVEEIASGKADLAIAAPPAGKPSGFGLIESLSRAGIKMATGRTMTRPLSGQRAMRAEHARALVLAAGFGVESAMTIDALRKGLRVVEVPSEITHARTGRDLAGFTHRAKQGIDVARALLPRLARRRLG